jgi:hypothetical protein
VKTDEMGKGFLSRLGDLNQHQIPNTKHPISSNHQNPKLSQGAMFRSLKIGVWNLFGIWNLMLGI